MSTYDELINAITYVRERTGDPNGWQTGLAPDEVAAVMTPTTRPETLEAIVRKIRQQHSSLFGATAPGGPPPGAPEPDRGQGQAAEAMIDAEAALAHQNSASSQLDMQVINAILNAHLNAVEGREALSKLQRETEVAVLTRSDLDTPAGARDFQRFLIGKLRDIRAVVLNASLDDTSKSALMAAWTSLYDASRHAPDERPAAPAVPVAAPADSAADEPIDDPGVDPPPDSMFADDPGPPTGDLPAPSPGGSATAPAAPAMPTTPAIPAIPGFGGAPIPGGLGGLPLPGLQDVGEERPSGSADPEPGDHPDDPHGDDEDKAHEQDVATDRPESPLAGPTAVTLPDGDTVTAASPQLAAAIQAAVGGAPIPDAFHQQGITIPPPGTAVPNPIDALQATPGDIGILTDRHALALGHEKALLDGQIQRIATVSGPNFLGWEHPPAVSAPASPPVEPHTPTPTGPAATSAT
ncbi:DUF4226 domain-containing protein [Mycobacterium interjectum]|uniref:DUF4226 domain-containing protein n=1 Tax=Mycobacterium interjectum TaxID=33895 RepID=UPI00082F834B|nr:DUF4226 domain-containing protein [Mycobacterium interjectum]MCV7089977.1 DUF4226 domain-containing protein [Mycobacterium interjectum]